MIAEFLEVTFSRHGTCKLLYDTSLALARSSPTRRYTGNIDYVVSVRRMSWFKNANNSTTAGTRRTKFGTQVGWPGPVIVLKFQHTATDGAPSARACVRH